MLYYVKNNFCRQILYIDQFKEKFMVLEGEITVER